jgi:Fe-S oxidoreductase
MPYWLHLSVYLLALAIALAYFSHSVGERLRALRAARSYDSRGGVGARLWGVVLHVLGQQRLLHGDFAAGLMHAAIFWGFVVVSINTLMFLIGGFLPSGHWELPLLGRTQPLGSLYILLRDIFEVLVLFAVGYALWRRLVTRPKRLHLSGEGVLILCLIAALMLTDWVLNAAAVGMGRVDAHVLSFVERLGGAAFASASFDAVRFSYVTAWWLHLLVFLVFLNLLPLSKHFHILTSVFKVYLRNIKPQGELPKLELEDENREEFGTSKLEALSWSNWLDAYSCTECGRCDHFCPAQQTGKKLSPQHIITDTREQIYGHLPQVLKALALVRAAEGADAAAANETETQRPALVGTVHTDEVLWACTTCGACDTHCPLFIEHVNPILEMRRHLVLDQASFPTELTSTFRGLENQGNPWGLAAHTRLAWAEGLSVPTLDDKPDAEWIYFVGCLASHDERNKASARALIELLNHAGFNYAVLSAETCCGDPARRCGNEYLAQSLIEVNAEQFKEAKPKKAFTACPHCFNTLRNEYQQFGVQFEEVIHHSELLGRLLAEGRLKPAGGSGATPAKVVYHDSCYLGRYNSVYHQPRDVVARALGDGTQLVEAKFSHDKGFCCGAGGGRMFMEETEGQRVNHWRYGQLAETGAELIAVACPFCMTMLDDAAQDSGAPKPVKDIAIMLRDALLGG